MKIIGLMGNGGSGKTSFANALSSKKNVGIIHVDDFVAEAKKKYFKFFLQPKKNNNTKTTINNPKLKSKAKKFFYKNKFAFNFLMKIRSMLVYKKILMKIEEFKKNGKELVIIDDWMLTTHKKLTNKLDHIYVLNRKFLSRRDSIRKRDNLSREESKIQDIPYSFRFVEIPSGENVTNISNNGTMEELESKALEVFKKYVTTPTFDERYKIKPDKSYNISISKDINRKKSDDITRL